MNRDWFYCVFCTIEVRSRFPLRHFCASSASSREFLSPGIKIHLEHREREALPGGASSRFLAASSFRHYRTGPPRIYIAVVELRTTKNTPHLCHKHSSGRQNQPTASTPPFWSPPCPNILFLYDSVTSRTTTQQWTTTATCLTMTTARS